MPLCFEQLFQLRYRGFFYCAGAEAHHLPHFLRREGLDESAHAAIHLTEEKSGPQKKDFNLPVQRLIDVKSRYAGHLRHRFSHQFGMAEFAEITNSY